MLSLLRTFIGTLFFFCCFGVVLLKNSPQDYRLAFNQNTNIPWATVKDVLSLDDIRENTTKLILLMELFEHYPHKILL